MNLIVSSCSLLSMAVAVHAAVIEFGDFSSVAGLQINGDARQMSTADGWVLRLTPKDPSLKRGSVYWTSPVAASGFRTLFVFRIISITNGPVDADGERGADGFVFVMQRSADGPAALGAVGDGLAYEGVQPSVAVEFDIWRNVTDAPNHDPSSNHLGVLTNGIVDHGVGALWTANITPHFDNTGHWYAWIDYYAGTLEVRVSQTPDYPATPSLSRPLDLAAILGGTTMFVGFSGATGSSLAEQRVLAWSFAPDMYPGDLNSDRRVDLQDAVLFRNCVTGPAISYRHESPLPGCTLSPDSEGFLPADLDHDGDVAQSDFGVLQRCWSGAGKPADPNCAN